ncbi:uncharacterized protein DDB_G0284671-like [Eleutherodactylus coqui]|uniref:uncharacterized protein DDB_G0284671-like n=1 Tax=Eleutherodactylus coqui TaxID=57060 RepID=UPI003461C88E
MTEHAAGSGGAAWRNSPSQLSGSESGSGSEDNNEVKVGPPPSPQGATTKKGSPGKQEKEARKMQEASQKGAPIIQPGVLLPASMGKSGKEGVPTGAIRESPRLKSGGEDGEAQERLQRGCHGMLRCALQGRPGGKRDLGRSNGLSANRKAQDRSPRGRGLTGGQSSVTNDLTGVAGRGRGLAGGQSSIITSGAGRGRGLVGGQSNNVTNDITGGAGRGRGLAGGQNNFTRDIISSARRRLGPAARSKDDTRCSWRKRSPVGGRGTRGRGLAGRRDGGVTGGGVAPRKEVAAAPLGGTAPQARVTAASQGGAAQQVSTAAVPRETMVPEVGVAAAPREGVVSPGEIKDSSMAAKKKQERPRGHKRRLLKGRTGRRRPVRQVPRQHQ